MAGFRRDGMPAADASVQARLLAWGLAAAGMWAGWLAGWLADGQSGPTSSRLPGQVAARQAGTGYGVHVYSASHRAHTTWQ